MGGNVRIQRQNNCSVTFLNIKEANLLKSGCSHDQYQGFLHASYSQGNTDIFGENAGRQCVPMSLCSLIYLYRNNSICDSNDLVNIMHLGNQLYSSLSRLSRQMYLLLEELPTMVSVEDYDYSVELYW